ncbi:oxidoreductase [Actinomycetospora sp. NBRC 106375]|nr:oxidoreductase [Actinomycetospora sp. NBRC 106375]
MTVLSTVTSTEGIMRVLVTGAAGHIGSAVVPELLRAGHDVVGLARSETSAVTVKELGAEARRGDVADLDGLRAAAADVDAVVHLAYDHDAVHRGDLADAAAADIAVVRALGEALAPNGGTLMGVGMTRTGDADLDRVIDANPRSAVTGELTALADRGVRTLLVAIPPLVHSDRDRGGWLPTLIGIARRAGVSGYVGDGAQHWPAAHTLDLAALYRLGLEQAPSGTTLRGATEPGVTVRAIAERIGRHLDVPAVSVPAERATEHFGPFGAFMAFDFRMDNAETRALVGWEPAHPGVLADLDAGHYFRG